MFVAFGGLFVGSDADNVTVGAVEDGDAVAPPQLTGDAPVVHVIDPFEVAGFGALRVDGGVTFAYGVAGHFRQLFNFDEPLQG